MSANQGRISAVSPWPNPGSAREICIILYHECGSGTFNVFYMTELNVYILDLLLQRASKYQ